MIEKLKKAIEEIETEIGAGNERAVEAIKEIGKEESEKQYNAYKKEKENEISELNKMVEMLEGKVESEQEVLNLTCWKSLAYCCSLERNCPQRDIALEVLGISKEDFTKIKKDAHKAFMEKSKINKIHKEDYETEKTAREAE